MIVNYIFIEWSNVNYSKNLSLKQHLMILGRSAPNRMLLYAVSQIQMTITSHGKSLSTTRTR